MSLHCPKHSTKITKQLKLAAEFYETSKKKNSRQEIFCTAIKPCSSDKAASKDRTYLKDKNQFIESN